ncbi:respiratory nitrate reductase subunit gamma [Gracilibacillus oryzae]|uniref:Respiratory nitrate reductase subunit gamma n=1 Tax=Gracilibacillus oryzae TaxID=1672701 RepID=A0A7C8GW48_9BACI|nr:respiratory nitrate reductase subunit gamma [Gracilibacillus oryzae]KAB8139445.1 respiratory nitrate reductase subunit gamma [Gracilibacillus oryzae]
MNNSIDWLLWGIIPYIVLTIFIGGHIYRYQKDQFGWSSKSSEFLEKKYLRIGSIMFHFGIFMVLGGHFLGILVPVSVYNSLGVTEHQYHVMALVFGIPAGIVAVIGLAILCYRRLSVKRIMKTTSKGDWAVLFFLMVVIISGLSATFLNVDSHGFDYRTTIAPWFRGLFVFNVQPELMAEVPVWFKIHLIANYAFASIWPFTRMVHVFSFPVRYLSRSFVIYKARL